MSSTTCPLCGEELLGDQGFVDHHVNSCIDSVGAGRAGESAFGAGAGAGAGAGSEAEDPFGTDFRDSQKGVASQIDHTDEEEESTCPLCTVSWRLLGIKADDEEGMTRHASHCMDGSLGGGGEDAWEDEDEVTVLTNMNTGEVAIINEHDASGRQGFGQTKPKETKLKSIIPWQRGNTIPVKGVSGLVPVLSDLLTRSHRDGRISSARLCVPTVDHIQTSFKSGDAGWGCGYRNAQMIFSSLRELPCYHHLTPKGHITTPIPTISECQIMIEDAWKAGHDPPGAAHFKHRLQNKPAWIGTTEVYTLLTWMGIRAKVIDFPKVKNGGSKNTIHMALVKWIVEYFDDPASSSSTSKRPANDAMELLMASNGVPVQVTKKQPLYLQHQGHSRTVVGIEKGKSGDWLLVFDPGYSPSMSIKKAAEARATCNQSSKRQKTTSSSPTSSSTIPTSSVPASFMAAAPGFSQIWEGKGKIVNTTSAWSDTSKDFLSNPTQSLAPYRVSLNKLSRNSEYQILFVEEGPLSEDEKVSRRVVTSTVVKGY
ncbi:DUF1671-domain-containing protein [Meredithblackwellia eburnea MCA 4105]